MTKWDDIIENWDVGRGDNNGIFRYCGGIIRYCDSKIG